LIILALPERRDKTGGGPPNLTPNDTPGLIRHNLHAIKCCSKTAPTNNVKVQILLWQSLVSFMHGDVVPINAMPGLASCHVEQTPHLFHICLRTILKPTALHIGRGVALDAQVAAFVYIYATISQIAEMTLSFYATHPRPSLSFVVILDGPRTIVCP
jgi:hypothetical protein